MPDLRSELARVMTTHTLDNLKFDDDAGPAQVIVATNSSQLGSAKSVMEQIWDFIKATPGCSAGDIARAFPGDASVTTRLTQLAKRNAVSRDGPPYHYTYHAVGEVYPKTDPRIALARAHEARRAGVKAVKQPKARSKQAPMPAPEVVQRHPAKLTAQYVMENIALAEAKTLHNQLKEIFG